MATYGLLRSLWMGVPGQELVLGDGNPFSSLTVVLPSRHPAMTERRRRRLSTKRLKKHKTRAVTERDKCGFCYVGYFSRLG